MESANTSPHDGQRLPSLAVADLLRTTVRLYIRRLRAFVLIMVVVAVPIAVLTEATTIATRIWTPPESRTGFVVSRAVNEVIVLVGGLGRTFAQAAIVVFAASTLQGQPGLPLHAYASVVQSVKGLIAFGGVIALVAVPIRIPPLIVRFQFWVLIGWFAATIALHLSWQQVYQALLLERRNVVSAIRRSWTLVGRRWLVLATCLLPLYALQWMPAAVIPASLGVLAVWTSGRMDFLLAQPLIGLGIDEDIAVILASHILLDLLMLTGQILTAPLVPILTTVFYVRRTAHETASRTATPADQPAP